MTIRDEVLAASRTQGPKCWVTRVLPLLSEEDRTLMDDMLDKFSGVQHSAIGAALRNRAETSGDARYLVSDQAVLKHRNDKCSCVAKPLVRHQEPA